MTRKVRDFMSTKVVTLTPESTMDEAVALEMRMRIRHIPILEGETLVGIVTDRDLKRAMPSLLTGTNREQHEQVMKSTKVGQIMTRSPLTTSPEAPLKDAVRILCEEKFGALPVVDGKKLVGIITETDLLRAFLQALEREA